MDDGHTSNNDSLSELPEDIQRPTAKRRAALVLAVMRGETSV